MPKSFSRLSRKMAIVSQVTPGKDDSKTNSRKIYNKIYNSDI